MQNYEKTARFNRRRMKTSRVSAMEILQSLKKN